MQLAPSGTGISPTPGLEAPAELVTSCSGLPAALSLRIAGPKCCGKSKGVELEHNSLKPGRSGAAQLEVGHSHGHALRQSAIIADYPAPTRDGRVTGPARTPCRDMTRSWPRLLEEISAA